MSVGLSAALVLAVALVVWAAMIFRGRVSERPSDAVSFHESGAGQPGAENHGSQSDASNGAD